MNAHRDFIDARRAHIARAVHAGRKKGLSEGQMIVMLADSQVDRDTWPAPPPAANAPAANAPDAPDVDGAHRGHEGHVRREGHSGYDGYDGHDGHDGHDGVQNVVDLGPPSASGVACVAMHVVVALTLLDSALHAVSRPPQPGFVRVLAFCNGTAFFTHASIPRGV